MKHLYLSLIEGAKCHLVYVWYHNVDYFIQSACVIDASVFYDDLFAVKKKALRP